MTDVLIITPDEVLEFVGVTEKIEEMYLRPHIRNCQQLELRSLLGTPLFNSLVEAVEQDLVTGATLTLLEQCKPMLSYYVMAAAYYDLSYKVTRKGILRQLDDASEAPSDAMIAMKAQQQRDLATSFANDLIEWLDIHSDEYELYRSDDTTSISKRTGSPIFTGYNKKTKRF